MGRHSSSGSVPKVDLNETAEDKARYKMNTKADPTKAIHEVQPGTPASGGCPVNALADHMQLNYKLSARQRSAHCGAWNIEMRTEIP